MKSALGKPKSVVGLVMAGHILGSEISIDAVAARRKCAAGGEAVACSS